MQRYFVVGDVHGCYNTLKSILQFWKPETEILIFVGDLIDRGNFTYETIKHVRQLQKDHPGKIIVLGGNHEQMACAYLDQKEKCRWYELYGKQILWDYHLHEGNFLDDLNWMKALPDRFETQHFFVSHAGVSNSKFAFDPQHPEGLIWTRSKLKNIGKLQIHGHTPVKGKPTVNPESFSINIDTGACYGKKLCALRLDENGTILEIIRVDAIPKDFE